MGSLSTRRVVRRSAVIIGPVINRRQVFKTLACFAFWPRKKKFFTAKETREVTREGTHRVEKPKGKAELGLIVWWTGFAPSVADDSEKMGGKEKRAEVGVAALQFSCTDDVKTNVDKAERMVREAAAKGANIILIQELFEGYYFCQAQREDFFGRAKPREGHPTIQRMQKLAKELNVVIPVSFFEQANCAHYNSVVIIDADGTDLGLYRKSHIPDGPGYQEKFYFNPGDTGFKVFQTKYAKIGVAICWDQWFPETARSLALMGAEVLFYPTAIGSEPQDANLDSSDHWKRVMQGHAGANLVPLVASNRVGKETIETEHGPSSITFYGHSFIAGPTGEILQEADKTSDTVVVAKFDLDEIYHKRASWGIFRDRRPELYKVLLTLDGTLP